MFQTDRLFILDAMALAHKNFYATPEDITIDTIKFLKDLMIQYDPTYLVVAAESRSKTFRHDLYPDYKAQRPEKDDNFVNSIPAFFGVFERLGLPIISVDGYEADDVIGTIATKYSNDFLQLVIVSNDKDFAQLVNSNVFLLKYRNGFNMLSKEQVEKNIGFNVDLLIDYMSLVGDTADNIKGAKGIGPVTAEKLVKSFGGIDNIYSNIHSIDTKVAQKLINSQESVQLSKELVTIKCDLDITIDLEDCRIWMDRLNGI